MILAIATLGVISSVTAGHQHMRHGDKVLRATRLAEHLLEEIQSRPYQGSGATRPLFHIDDYDGFAEPTGDVRDFTGALYDDVDQVFSRSVSVGPVLHSFPALGAAPLPGKTVTVTIADGAGGHWQLSRFIAEPGAP